MREQVDAAKACLNPNPIIDGRKANVNLAYIGAKPRIGHQQLLMKGLAQTIMKHRADNGESSEGCTYANLRVVGFDFFEIEIQKKKKFSIFLSKNQNPQS